MTKQIYHCARCEAQIDSLNDLEQEDYDKTGEFVCSTCINKEMEIPETISIKVSWCWGEKGEIIYDEDSMREDFDTQLRRLTYGNA